MSSSASQQDAAKELMPFSEQREELGKVTLSVSADRIADRPRLKSASLTMLPLPGLPSGAVVHVHQSLDDSHDNSGLMLINVDVDGVPADADVWLRGEFRWWLRNRNERVIGKVSDFHGYPVPKGPATWARGNGRLAAFVRLHTRRISGTVTVFGRPACGARVGPDLSALRGLDALCDVVLRAAGRDFPAHRAALAARSPVFLAMFSGDFKEAQDKTVDIAVGCSGEVFAAFVEYLYSGALGKRDCGDVLHLLELADRYLVADLQAECLRRLAALEPREALEVFEASLQLPFVPKDVREKVLVVIRSNWSALTASEGWAKFCATQPEAALTMETMMAAPLT